MIFQIMLIMLQKIEFALTQEIQIKTNIEMKKEKQTIFDTPTTVTVHTAEGKELDKKTFNSFEAAVQHGQEFIKKNK